MDSIRSNTTAGRGVQCTAQHRETEILEVGKSALLGEHLV